MCAYILKTSCSNYFTLDPPVLNWMLLVFDWDNFALMTCTAASSNSLGISWFWFSEKNSLMGGGVFCGKQTFSWWLFSSPWLTVKDAPHSFTQLVFKQDISERVFLAGWYKVGDALSVHPKIGHVLFSILFPSTLLTKQAKQTTCWQLLLTPRDD